MGLFGERFDLLRQLNAAQERLEFIQDERNNLLGRVREVEQRERRLREALEFLVKHCSAEPGGSWAAALEMARGALGETDPQG